MALLLCALLFAAVGCRSAPPASTPLAARISAPALLGHIRTLASDEFEGRAPGSRGEALTIDYLERRLRAIGVEPVAPGGGYLQAVPLVGIAPQAPMSLVLHGRGGALRARFGEDFIAWTKRMEERVAADAELVFAGYGVQAPEYRWDDFKGTDVRGKALVVLVNDPPVEGLFGGAAMTYYGRWTYKFEKAAELGAAACFIVHRTERAGYGWDVVVGSFGGEQFDVAAADRNRGRVAVEGWVTHDLAGVLARIAGRTLEDLEAAAARRDFRPVPLGVRASIAIRSRLRAVVSHNVAGRIAGGDPRRKDEAVVYVAHWDHFGVGAPVNGQRIYHGARDNASGVAALLEIARAFRSLPKPPARSIVLLATTAEEQGLLGSRWAVEHPIVPPSRIAAVVNVDGLNVLGRTRDVVMIGRGLSTIDAVVDEAAAAQGRSVRGDPEPEKGYFYRSDHFSFVREGVPAFDPEPGIDYVGRPEGWGVAMRDEYLREDYHRPSDVVRDDWDLRGAVEDVALYFDVGRRIADAPAMPEWNPGAEFRAKRLASLAAARSAR